MKKIIIAFCGLLLFASCLRLQDSYQYEPKNSSGETNLSAWDFIKSRPDIFSSLRDAVRLCDEDSLLYMQTDNKYTYLLQNNTAMAISLTNFGTDNGGTFSSWSSAVSVNKQWVRNMLRYHIVDGFYHSKGTITFDPVYAITLWRDQKATLSLQLSKSTSFQYYGMIRINLMMNTTDQPVQTVVTSNLFNTNGVSHVIGKPAKNSFK